TRADQFANRPGSDRRPIENAGRVAECLQQRLDATAQVEVRRALPIEDGGPLLWPGGFHRGQEDCLHTFGVDGHAGTSNEIPLSRTGSQSLSNRSDKQPCLSLRCSDKQGCLSLRCSDKQGCLSLRQNRTCRHLQRDSSLSATLARRAV